VFKDIEVTGPHVPASSFRGFDAGHGVEGVRIANLRFSGKPAGNVQEARLHIGPHVGHVQFSDPAPSPGIVDAVEEVKLSAIRRILFH